ncbi:MAG: transposase [Phycisphaerales bacterium]|nr:transposase [Phycisphaerales bacterium]
MPDIHVILDNYRIHHSQFTRAAGELASDHALHFLPPYSPNDNRIGAASGRTCTRKSRNHRCSSMEELMKR